MSNSSNNKRIAKNTAILYVRTLLTMFISLYTSRIILQVLGIEDFGIYNVVGGIVVMFSFLNSAMSTATQRYFSYALGQEDVKELNKLFSITINIHFFIALVIIILAESIGLWFLNTQLNISSDKLLSANWVFQFSILTFCVGVISVPYNALIISYEKMNIYAYVSLFENFAKLMIVFILPLLTYNRLILYAILLFILSFVVRIFYFFYCRSQFPLCRYSFVLDKNKSKELISYASWNLFGNLAAVGFTQGINILINIFFGPILNAANGIANQVNSAISTFVGNFQMALNPQIVKSYAINNQLYVQSLICQGSRFSFYLLLILMLPIFYQTEIVLVWWLKDIPAYTVPFTQLILINALINTLSGTLMTAVQATGCIKKYQVIVGSILLLNVPVSYFFLKVGFSVEIVQYVMIVISVLATFSRILILQQLGILNFYSFVQKVIFNVLFVSGAIFIICGSLNFVMDFFQYTGFFVRVFCIEIVAFLCIWFIGLNKYERTFVIGKIGLLKWNQ